MRFLVRGVERPAPIARARLTASEVSLSRNCTGTADRGIDVWGSAKYACLDYSVSRNWYACLLACFFCKCGSLSILCASFVFAGRMYLRSDQEEVAASSQRKLENLRKQNSDLASRQEYLQRRVASTEANIQDLLKA